MSLVDYLTDTLKTPRIIKAFENIDRKDFVPNDFLGQAYHDIPLPIGWGQTISQPSVVAFMLEQLQPQPGDKILDIGSGSGWTSALLAEIVGKQGRIVAMEFIPELAEITKKNVSKYGFVEKGIIKVIQRDGSKGYSSEAPYDKILVSASGQEISEAWKEQLKINGRIVAPVDSSIYLLIKKDQGFKKTEFPGFLFVPLVK